MRSVAFSIAGFGIFFWLALLQDSSGFSDSIWVKIAFLCLLGMVPGYIYGMKAVIVLTVCAVLLAFVNMLQDSFYSPMYPLLSGVAMGFTSFLGASVRALFKKESDSQGNQHLVSTDGKIVRASSEEKDVLADKPSVYKFKCNKCGHEGWTSLEKGCKKCNSQELEEVD